MIIQCRKAVKCQTNALTRVSARALNQGDSYYIRQRQWQTNKQWNRRIQMKDRHDSLVSDHISDRIAICLRNCVNYIFSPRNFMLFCSGASYTDVAFRKEISLFQWSIFCARFATPSHQAYRSRPHVDPSLCKARPNRIL